MSKRSWLFLGLALLVVAGVALLAYGRPLWLSWQAQAEVRSGRWIEAFRHYHMLQDLNPGDPSVRASLAETAKEVVPTMPLRTADIDVEIGAIRLLAEGDDLATLAHALDQASVPIPAGSFLMGTDTSSPNEGPAREVYLDGYRIDRYEVTNAQYQAFVLATGHKPPRYWPDNRLPAGTADYPVVGISWPDALAYCKWVGKRLPTEAEWEKSCRGTDGRLYPWKGAWDPAKTAVNTSAYISDPLGFRQQAAEAWELVQKPWAFASRGQVLLPIGSLPKGMSPYGVLDLAGNASEWVMDWYDPSAYSKLPARNPVLTEALPVDHVVRGGAWSDLAYGSDFAQERSRCAARSSSHDGEIDQRSGFRCVAPGP
jgi:formylglycine-generating enzyme required for sulfatase activity